MTLGNWTPNTQDNGKTLDIDKDLLLKFISLSQNQLLDNLDQQLSKGEIQQQAALMQLDQDRWVQASNQLEQTQIELLMRFFTKAEQLPGWEAGDHSPVIWLGKVLKKRKIGISKELSLWIKNNSDNRFLPHGSLL